MSCLAVMYHYVRDASATPFPGIRALPPTLFEQQLDWLEAEYTVVHPRQLEAALNGSDTLPPNAAVLTFDDGYVDHYETVFPILRARRWSGVFYVAEDGCGERPRMLNVHLTHFLLARLGAERFGRAVRIACERLPSPTGGRDSVFGVDRWDDSDERAVKHLLNYELPFDLADGLLRELFAEHIGDADSFARGLYLDAPMIRQMARGGMVFGYHTRRHRMLSRLTPAEQESELRSGVEWIRGLTGQATVSFCYPWGGPQTYTSETLRILNEAGYSLAFNTVRRRLALGVDGRYELPRFDTRDLPPYTRGEADAVAAAAGEA